MRQRGARQRVPREVQVPQLAPGDGGAEDRSLRLSEAARPEVERREPGRREVPLEVPELLGGNLRAGDVELVKEGIEKII